MKAFIKNLVVDKIEEVVQVDLDNDGDIGGVKQNQGNNQSHNQSHNQHQSQPGSYSAAAAQHPPEGNHVSASAGHASHSSSSHSATRTDTRPSSDELNNLSLACSALWDLDCNRLTPGREYELDLQGSKHNSYHKHDVADGSLFKKFDAQAIKRYPTYEHFLKLLDNYERSTGISESVTSEEKAENHRFLDAALETPPMQYTHRYLAAKGVVSDSVADFKDYLYTTWFHLYRRGTYRDSCGFEHVFVGEEKQGKITGFHNWLQFYLEEKNGKVDYKGYIMPPRRGRKPDGDLDGDEHLLSVQFAWGDEEKPISTLFIGTDPAFEMALYTLCFGAGHEKTKAYLGGYDIVITAHKIAGNKLGTCYPDIG